MRLHLAVVGSLFVAVGQGCTQSPRLNAEAGASTVVDVVRRSGLTCRASAIGVRDGAFVISGAADPRMSVRIDPRANGAVHLDLHRPHHVAIDIEPIDLAAVPLESVTSLLVGRNVATETDVVHTITADSTEEFRVFRSASARTEAHYQVHVPSGTQVRANGSVVEVVEPDGTIVASTTPIYAVDASGTHRDAAITVERKRDDLYALHVVVLSHDLKFPVVLDPAWTVGAAMSVARLSHRAIALSSGRVLVCGGNASSGLTASCELFNPTTNTWSAAAPMPTVRATFGMTLLADGRVLVAGGTGFGSATQSSAVIYTPSSDSWASTGTMATARAYLDLALMGDGRVLAGGSGPPEVFNPSTGSWSAAAPMGTPRDYAALRWLPAGYVLVAGGWMSASPYTKLTTAERYNPSTNSWTSAGSTGSVHMSAPMMALGDGRAMIIAGEGSTAVDIYSPSTNSWSVGPSLGIGRNGHSAATLTSGRVLVAGGSSSPATEVFDTTLNRWLSAGSLSVARSYLTVSPLPGGRAVVAGGNASGPGFATVDVYDPVALGAACTLAGECTSGYCVDGVCCNTACTNTCSACNLTGTAGTCTAVASGPPVAPRTCSRYACSTGSCLTSCTAHVDCDNASYCQGTACLARKGLGGACASARECTSNFCADGYCCNSACGGQCEACDLTGSVGTCTAVSGAPRGSRPACSGVAPYTTCGSQCLGVDRTKCVYAPTSTTCSANACSGGLETHVNACDGTGLCRDAPKSCGAYKCGTTTCLTSCADNAQCASGFYCSSSTCVPLEGLGVACTSVALCATGHCTDGVCCGEADCGTGRSCALDGSKGVCAKKNGTACTIAAECGSGNCVDGVCCDRACAGQCEACDVEGSAGACSPVKGTPHGSRPACDDGGGDRCRARTCDGVVDHATNCAAFQHKTTEVCAPASCAGSSFTSESTCSGAGACITPKETSCVPYACDAKGCKTMCAADADCASGFRCKSSACVTRAAECSPDRASSIPKTGDARSCDPFLCDTETGECRQNCTDTSQCATGRACDMTTSQCTTPATTGDDGGCAFGPTRRAGLGALALLVAVALVCRRRR